MDIIKEDCARIADIVDLSPLKGKRVLVTGANGFIGQFIVSALYYANETKKLNCKIACLDLMGPNPVIKRYLSSKHIAFAKANLAKPFKVSGKFDYIFHAAGYGQPAKFINDPFPTIAVNVDAAKTLLEIAKRSQGTFCYFSSAETYGDIPMVKGGIAESFTGAISSMNPRAIYGESKRLGEAVAATYERLFGVRTKIFRISHLYGPGISIHDTRVLGDIIRKALTEKKISLMDSGEAVKTFGYIADAVSMMLHIALYGKEMVYHVGGQDSVSIRGLAEEVGRHTGAPVIVPKTASTKAHIGVDPRFVGLNLDRILGEMKKFSMIPLSEGLRRTVLWNQEEFKDELRRAR